MAKDTNKFKPLEIPTCQAPIENLKLTSRVNQANKNETSPANGKAKFIK